MKFGTYLTEAKKNQATFTFGRFQPPTIGHEALFQRLERVATSKRDMFIFGSNTHDRRDNPLRPKTKLYYMKRFFPKYKNNIIIDDGIRTFINAATWLYEKGYTSLVMVAGSDRIKKFDTLLNRYNGLKQANGDYFHFDSIHVMSAGQRDPDEGGITGASASKARKFAYEDDFESFKEIMPGDLPDNELRILMDSIRG